ncbi:MAG: hypothetical protein ACJA2N_000333 [Salibacteraceae bacterium]|jgi:hypothetical protein
MRKKKRKTVKLEEETNSMKYLTSVLLLSFTIIGCQSQKMASNDSDISSILHSLTDSSIIISLEQTACYGTCPVHKIVVLKNGYASYHGERHVAQIGDYYATFTPEQIDLIYVKANQFHFFELEKEYTAPMTDLPTTLIFIATDSLKNAVSAYGEYPKNLEDFIAFLGQDLQKIVWTKKK